MRLGGFEPPTRGLEGRRSSAELQALAVRVAPWAGLLLDAVAEIGGHDRDRAAPELAARRADVQDAEPDLAPPARKQVLAVARAVHPHANRRRRAQVGRAIREVLPDLPRAEAAGGVEALDALPKRAASTRLVLEETVLDHLAR